MRKKFVTIVLALATVMSFAIAGCGVEPITTPEAAPPTVSGVAATGAPISGSVYLKDSSKPAKTRMTETDENGKFSIDVQGLKAPYKLKAEWKENDGDSRLYSFARKKGKANINPLSNSAVAGASRDGNPDRFYDKDDDDDDENEDAAEKLEDVIDELRTVLAPLFELYQTGTNPVDDDFEADNTGLDAMFDDVKFEVTSGQLVVTNRQTGLVIFSASLDNISAGTFYPENMPEQADGAALYAANCASCHGALEASEAAGESAKEIREAIKEEKEMRALSSLTSLEVQAIASALSGETPTPTPTPEPDPTPTPTPVDGAALYDSNCGSCHGALETSSKKNASASSIQSAISNNKGGMSSLSSLTTGEIQAIADALATTTPTPAACTYTYDVWGECQSNGTQTRNLLSTTPSGCAGTPVLSQSCTYVPPAPSACTYTYDAWGTCQPDGTQSRNMLTASPSGCVGTPVLSQACTYVPPAPAACSYTYETWGACQSDGTQTRNLISALPSGCAGTPTLSQTCTYVPPAPTACTYTYDAWGACQSNNTQTRNLLTSSPSGCVGTPVLSQTCTYTAPIDGAALYTQYCSGCHGSGKKGKSVSAIQSAISSNKGGMGSLSFLTTEQIQAISTAP